MDNGPEGEVLPRVHEKGRTGRGASFLGRISVLLSA